MVGALFHLENPVRDPFGGLGKSRWRKGVRRYIGWSFCKPPQITLLVPPAFIYVRAADLPVFTLLAPRSFVKPRPGESLSRVLHIAASREP